MFREKLKTFIESPVFTNAIVVLILINAVTLGMETGDKFLAKYGSALHLIDEAILGIFVLEMLLKFYVYRLSFFRSGWNVFDLSIISVSLLPATGPLAI